MNVAIISESETDEQVVCILAQAVLGEGLTAYRPRIQRRTGGWTTVIPTVEKVIRLAYFGDHRIDGVIAVMDSDDSVFDPPDSPSCRLQQMRSMVDSFLADVSSKSTRPALHVALGLAVPALEAWLRCGIDPHVNEAAWASALQSGQYAYDRRSLKKDVYGSARHIDAAKALAEGHRLADDITQLETHFPIGFGALANDLRQWPRA